MLPTDGVIKHEYVKVQKNEGVEIAIVVFKGHRYFNMGRIDRVRDRKIQKRSSPFIIRSLDSGYRQQTVFDSGQGFGQGFSERSVSAVHIFDSGQFFWVKFALPI